MRAQHDNTVCGHAHGQLLYQCYMQYVKPAPTFDETGEGAVYEVALGPVQYLLHESAREAGSSKLASSC